MQTTIFTDQGSLLEVGFEVLESYNLHRDSSDADEVKIKGKP